MSGIKYMVYSNNNYVFATTTAILIPVLNFKKEITSVVRKIIK